MLMSGKLSWCLDNEISEREVSHEKAKIQIPRAELQKLSASSFSPAWKRHQDEGGTLKMDIRKLAAEGRTEEIERQLMDLDSQFFKCRKCGKHQDTILFNTRDIFNIACKLQLTMEEVINEYAETYIGSASKIPVVHKQVHTVREWLARFGIPEHDELFLVWSRLTAMLHRMIRELEAHHVSNETLNLF